MRAVTHLEKVITGEVLAETHLEKVIAEETSAETYIEKVITGEAPPITHLQRVIAGIEDPITHLEQVWAGRTPEPTEHEYTGAVPVTITANGQPLLDYLISGNMSQTGTPTHDNPIQPQETGERTGNLFDVTLFHNGYHINSQGNIETFTGRIATTTPIDVSNYTSVTFSYTTTRDNDNFIYATFSDNTLVERVAGKTSGFTIDTTNCNKLYLCLYNLSSQVSTADINTAMLNEGSMAQSYEPYGYKLDISSANTTTPVYLGEVETTRKIYKMAFDGTENITSVSIGTGLAFLYIPEKTPNKWSTADNIVSSHFKSEYANNDGNIYFTANRMVLINLSCATVEEFKQYLTDQYAAGTPVVVWYVLSSATTGIVNEPIRKIGDYADTVSMEQAGVSIPTLNGQTVVDVDTTLKPSEVYIKYKG